MEEKENGIFNSEANALHNVKGELKDKEYYDVKNAEVKYIDKAIDLQLKQGKLVYKTESDNALQNLFEILQRFLRVFTEVVPFEALGKDIEESQQIHIAAVEKYKREVIKALDASAQNEDAADA
ncbi:MAG: hypothetical protein FWB90_02895 [Fibromonadales bacterium]|nr:hypothetical protein [Fibromonadales bacterium]